MKWSHHEVSDSEAELVDQQQREVDHLSAVLRASREESKTFHSNTQVSTGLIPCLEPGEVKKQIRLKTLTLCSQEYFYSVPILFRKRS